MPLQVVSIEEHERALERIDQLERDVALIKSLLLSEQWLSRTQAMQALSIGKTKLCQLTKDRALTFMYEGRRPRYSVDSIRQYLASKKIEAWAIDQRIIAATRI